MQLDESLSGICALETDVRIGYACTRWDRADSDRPLLPNTCQSIRMRFLALQPGVHAIEELQLLETGTRHETRLRNVLTVVVGDA